MELKIFELPNDENLLILEEKFCELVNRYRKNPTDLDPVELDYMDWANNVLIGI
jgi:hypothetical protein